MTEITDADQLTGSEFKKLLRKQKTWFWIIGVTIVVGVFIGLAAGPVGGVIAAVVTVLAGIGLTYATAGDKAENAFYASYAKSRGLARSAKGLGQATPLLRKGDKRRTDAMFSGQLAPGVKGSLALYTYINVTRDSKGNKTETPYPFTIVTTQMPKVAEHLKELSVQKRSGFRSLEGLEDKFLGSLERVEFESEALDDRYEIFADESQDPVWLRQLFSPSFIVWLTDHPMKDFAFEFGQGKLVAYTPGHRENTEEFDRMISASCELALKLRAEAKQSG